MEKLKILCKRFEWGGRLFNAFVAVTCFRFSLSFVSDVFWYVSPLRKGAMVTLLTFVLWISWLFRPWAELEREERREE